MPRGFDIDVTPRHFTHLFSHITGQSVLPKEASEYVSKQG